VAKQNDTKTHTVAQDFASGIESAIQAQEAQAHTPGIDAALNATDQPTLKLTKYATEFLADLNNTLASKTFSTIPIPEDKHNILGATKEVVAALEEETGIKMSKHCLTCMGAGHCSVRLAQKLDAAEFVGRLLAGKE